MTGQSLGRPIYRGLADKLWFNALWFQCFWLCAVLGRGPMVPVLAILLAVHLWLVPHRVHELLWTVPIALLGIAVDAGLSLADVYRFPGDVVLPLWLMGLWLAFATTVRRSLGFLTRHPALVWIAGAVALPFNYWAGQRLGAVEFGLPLPQTLALLAVIWLVVLPLMYRLAARHSAEALKPCY